MADVSGRTETKVPAIFDGVPPDELAAVLNRSEQRHFDPGDVVIAEGDATDKVLVVNSGSADVTVVDRDGIEHQVGRVGHGMTLGEMSLVTGEPAAATVRAAAELELVSISRSDFEQLAATFPVVYRNMGAMLAERLAKTNRLVAQPRTAQLVELLDVGAPPELPWALACSLSWHTRRPTLLLVLDPDPHESLRALAERHASPSSSRAALRLIPSVEAFRHGSLGSEMEEVRSAFDHILVLRKGLDAGQIEARKRLRLAGADGSAVDGGATSGECTLRAWSATAPARLGPDQRGVVAVPALQSSEQDSLRDGILRVDGQAGRAIGWVARDLAGLKVGYALGAGSMRGYAHIGVLKGLEQAGIAPDYIAGTSVGSAIASLYADGRSTDNVADELDRCGRVLFRPTLSRRGFLSNRALRRYLESIGPERTFDSVQTPLAIVAADVDNQQEVVIRQGLVWMAVLASISIPGVFPAVKIAGRTLVDGGILNPVPASAVTAMGAGGVIAVRLGTPAAAPEHEVVAADQSRAKTTALGIILRSIEIMQGRIAGDVPDTPLVTLAPEFPELAGAKLRRFSSGRRYIDSGIAAGEEALPRLSTVFPWLRPLTDR